MPRSSSELKISLPSSSQARPQWIMALARVVKPSRTAAQRLNASSDSFDARCASQDWSSTWAAANLAEDVETGPVYIYIYIHNNQFMFKRSILARRTYEGKKNRDSQQAETRKKRNGGKKNLLVETLERFQSCCLICVTLKP